MSSKPDNRENNKRIARNTVVLYLRMLLSTVVSLYTSRVVLNTLGVENYGIYVVVGGVVGMFGFINASMGMATARFLTYELGIGNTEKLNKTFSSSVLIHYGLAALILILAETIGLWTLYNKLIIPAERLDAAFWVFQLSIISTILTITQVPYNASINAHERMSVFAYIDLLGVSLKLLAIYLLVVLGGDKLIIYAILILSVSFITLMIARLYCRKHFPECHFRFVWDWGLLKPMLNFSALNLYGELCIAARRDGTPMVTNMFFGPVLNTASSIATTIEGTISGLAWKSVSAANPQIVKSYARGDYSYTNFLVAQLSRFSSFFYLLFAIPLLIETKAVVTLWLGDLVPSYTFSFTQISIVAGLFGILHAIFGMAISATGNIRRVSFISGTLYLLNLATLYICLACGAQPEWIFLLYLLFTILIFISNLSILRKQLPCFSLRGMARSCFYPLMGTVIPSFFLSYYLNSFIQVDLKILEIIYACCISWGCTIPIALFIMLNKEERSKLFSWIQLKLLRR